MLRMLMKKVRRRDNLYLKIYDLFDGICILVAVNLNSHGLSGGKLICSALEIQSQVKRHFSSLNRYHVCIERDEFLSPVGTPSVCNG